LQFEFWINDLFLYVKKITDKFIRFYFVYKCVTIYQISKLLQCQNCVHVGGNPSEKGATFIAPGKCFKYTPLCSVCTKNPASYGQKWNPVPRTTCKECYYHEPTLSAPKPLTEEERYQHKKNENYKESLSQYDSHLRRY